MSIVRNEYHERPKKVLRNDGSPFTHQPDPRRFLDRLQDAAAREARDVLGVAEESEDLHDDSPLEEVDA